MSASNKKGLGRGLNALFSNSINDMIGSDPNNDNQVSILKVFEIKPNPDQPRKKFDEQLLDDLANSIKEHGVLQPILVRPYKTGDYQIIAGERRWRAAKIAGLKEIPAIIKDLKDIETLEIALIENLQRSDLNVIEEALSYKFLIDEYHISQESIAQKVNKSRSAIANILRLLNLPKDVIEMVKDNKISSGHARALLSLDDENKIQQKALEIIEKNLSVRDIEQSVKKEKKLLDKSNVDISSDEKNFCQSLQKDIADNLKRNIKIKYNTHKLEIEFFNKQDLINITNKLKNI